MLINPRRQSRSTPRPLYTASACAELDRQVITAGTPGYELMQRAARSAWLLLQQRWPQMQRINVFCGGGNNGGDGLLVALYAAQAGMAVRLWLAINPADYCNEAAQAWADVAAYGLQPQTTEPTAVDFAEDEVLVDALLGIGLQGEVRGKLVDWIAAINAAKAPVLALDTPSGLWVDSGEFGHSVVRADITLTFIACKPGLFTGRGAEVCGEVLLSDLGIKPEDWPVQVVAGLQQQMSHPLSPRKAAGHKGDHGRLLIIGGLTGMGGAALLAAQAALRCGAGMVKVITAPEYVAAFLAAQPEIMVEALQDKPQQQLQRAFDWADVLLIGPGLGQSPLAHELWQASWNFNGAQLVDADALNLWAAGLTPPNCPQRVVTPHPGEAARLLGLLVDQVQQNRLRAVNQLVQHTASVVLLKGAGSLVATPDGQQLPLICPFGNPGMGVAGMGDLLSGCIAALMAQGFSADQAAQLGVRIHAQAGDQAAGDQPRGLLPSDLLPYLRKGVN
ncbi:MAG: NAD(P)H-hydrate dehydratase [Marinospirillum sp.]|uniref:NAD(P)H-hydrate dehydratase n=1 Tax=Marinospirillum sp. TaxID=2183934 RepID=UPI0019F4F2DB|nr:NAD(P)H-hydrate dehydratase [Marinospirillum sp.]MBE0505763.1 NAD(P)H-hydrate dehydratase [Marinospirillum sp.]